jgi:hypothetical protein
MVDLSAIADSRAAQKPHMIAKFGRASGVPLLCGPRCAQSDNGSGR